MPQELPTRCPADEGRFTVCATKEHNPAGEGERGRALCRLLGIPMFSGETFEPQRHQRSALIPEEGDSRRAAHRIHLINMHIGAVGLVEGVCTERVYFAEGSVGWPITCLSCE